MKLTDGNRSGDSDDFVDLAEEDEPLLKDFSNERNKSDDDYGDDDYDGDDGHDDGDDGDDEIWSEEDHRGEKKLEYVDLNGICQDIRSDVKDCLGYVLTQSGIFFRRLKDEWNDLVFGDSYEYDFQGTGTIGESLEEL